MRHLRGLLTSPGEHSVNYKAGDKRSRVSYRTEGLQWVFSEDVHLYDCSIDAEVTKRAVTLQATTGR